MPKQALLDVIAAQKSRYSVRELLNAAYTQEPSERNGLFKVIAEIAETRITERGATRGDDKTSETSMEDRKRVGYF